MALLDMTNSPFVMWFHMMGLRWVFGRSGFVAERRRHKCVLTSQKLICA